MPHRCGFSRRPGSDASASIAASPAVAERRSRRRSCASTGGRGMARLIYVSNVSLDGYIEDEQGSFDWTAPGDELFAFITALVRPVGTYLYGRRLYDTMAPWETDPALGDQSKLMADFASVWQAADKVVYST